MQQKRKIQTTSTKCQYQAAASKPKWWSGLKWPLGGAPEADHQEAGADDDVEAVEARRHEEGRGIDALGEAEGRMGVLVGLQGSEDDAEADGGASGP